MVGIPKQLENHRFIKTAQKVPIEGQWNTVNNYSLEDDEYRKYLDQAKGYGVLTGYENLIVIDCDSEFIADQLMQHEPYKSTFRVVTATKGLPHFYFYCDVLPKSIKVLDKDGKTLADVQGYGKMVIGAGTVLKDGNMYKVDNDAPIMQITYAEILELMNEFDETNKVLLDQVNMDDAKNTEDYIEEDDIIVAIKEKMTVKKVLDLINIPTNKNPTDTPFGNSVNKRCFSYDDIVWHDFHSGKSGNIFQLYMEVMGKSFPETKRIFAEKVGICIDKIQEKAIEKIKSKPINSNGDLYHIVTQLILNKQVNEATEKMAEYFLSQNSVFSIRDDKIDEVWIYKEGIYIPNGSTYINEFCRDVLEKGYNKRFTKQVLNKIIADTYISKEEFFKTEPPHLIPFNNTILNINTGELIKHSSNFRFFAKIRTDYNPSKNCPNIIKFIEEVMDKQDIVCFQEFVGSCLYSNFIDTKSIIFLGKGRNGKSILIKLINALLGEENVSSINLRRISEDKYAIFELFSKFANLSGDVDIFDFNKTGMFKELTGGDYVSAPRKFLPDLRFVNFAKMVFSSNSLPNIKDMSDGFFERWLIFIFEKQFLKKSKYDRLKHKNPHVKLDNPYLLSEITTSDELSGFLNWALEGLKRLLKNKSFSDSKYNNIKDRIWFLNSNSFKVFMDENLERDKDGYIKKQDLRDAYDLFVKKHSANKSTLKEIKQQLEDTFGVDENRINIGDKRPWIWEGIKFKEKVRNTKIPDF
jgi:P4 family phage/plasmid primase-like protien